MEESGRSAAKGVGFAEERTSSNTGVDRLFDCVVCRSSIVRLRWMSATEFGGGVVRIWEISMIPVKNPTHSSWDSKIPIFGIANIPDER
ncbi:hypothetical protein JTB14_013165 [Gonioctena quinquepunctata]|nr:hypothetical protein JTB14_013165 [Gonioctena quinquepunctata]